MPALGHHRSSEIIELIAGPPYVSQEQTRGARRKTCPVSSPAAQLEGVSFSILNTGT